MSDLRITGRGEKARLFIAEKGTNRWVDITANAIDIEIGAGGNSTVTLIGTLTKDSTVRVPGKYLISNS